MCIRDRDKDVEDALTLSHRVIERVKKISKGGHPQYGAFKQRKFEVPILYPDVKKAKKKINWKTSMPFEKGLKITINSFR